MTAARGHFEGGGCHQCLTMMQAPKQKCLVAMREGAMVLSGSSNAMTNEDDNLG